MSAAYWIGWSLGTLLLFAIFWPAGIIMGIIALLIYPLRKRGKKEKEKAEALKIENAVLKERLKNFGQKEP